MVFVETRILNDPTILNPCFKEEVLKNILETIWNTQDRNRVSV